MFLNSADEMYRNNQGENAKGLLAKHKEAYLDLKESSIPDDVDEKTQRELSLAFERQYNAQTNKIISWQVQQAPKADAEARKFLEGSGFEDDLFPESK